MGKILTLDNVPIFNRKIGKIDTIDKLLKSVTYKVGDVVEILGNHSASDGGNHKRKIELTNDGSGIQLNNGLWANMCYNTFEDNRIKTENKTIVGSINENFDNIKINSANIKGAISNFNRPKLFWNSGSSISVGDIKFSMNGFRFMGRQYKTGMKNYYVESNQLGNGNNSICHNVNDLEVCVNKPLESWVGIFAVKTASDTCRLKLVPFMQVMSVGGDFANRINISKTKEKTWGTQAWDLDLKEDIANRDILVITQGNRFYGKVHKVKQKYGSDAIITTETLGLSKGDYLLIAPTNEEYCYLGSAYIDTVEFRNRSDDGKTVFSYGVVHPQTYTLNTFFDLLPYNLASPLASSLYTSVRFLSSNTTTGSAVVYSGGDDGHTFSKHTSVEKWVGRSVALETGLIKDNFDFVMSLGYKVLSEICTVENTTIRVWGYDEV